MIIPVRCFTCAKVLADKWDYYVKRCKELEKAEKDTSTPKYFDKNPSGAVLDELGLTKMCCRRHMLGHVDLIETI
jgi:DNA-directed RNA polymerase I, II, and III subunit RPABC5